MQPKDNSVSYYNKILGMGHIIAMHSAVSVTDLPGLFVDLT